MIQVDDLITWGSMIAAAVGLQGVVLWVLNRRQNRASTRHTNAQATQVEVEVMRSIVAEVRKSDEAKSEQIARLETRMGQLEDQLRSIHIGLVPLNAWAVAAHQAILPHNPEFPGPPPIDTSYRYNP